MKLTEAHRARLYALTAVACAIWLVQSLMEASRDGSILTWPTLVFSICLVVVVGYTGFNAVRGWSAHEGDEAARGKSDVAERHHADDDDADVGISRHNRRFI